VLENYQIVLRFRKVILRRSWLNLIALGAAVWLALVGMTLGDTRKPTVASTEVKRAAHALEAGNIKEAVQILNKLLSVSPNHPELLNMLGIARGKEGDARESETVSYTHLTLPTICSV